MRHPHGWEAANRMEERLLHLALRPTQNRMSRPAGAAHSGSQKINGTAEYKAAEACAQPALVFAARRAAALDLLADCCLQFGMGDAAERLSHRAASIREAVQ